MQREILKPQVNIPLLLKLDFGPEGSERDGNYGKQWMYTVNDDQAILFLPLEAREAILASGAQAGDEIGLCKRAKGKWEVQRIGDAAEIPEPEPPKPQPLPRPTKRAPFPPASYYQPTPQLDSPLPISNGHRKVNGAGSSTPTNGATHANGTTQVSGNPTAKHLGECMKLAIDACLIAQEYAHEKNFGLTFLGGDIKSLALSIYINDQEKRR